MPATVAPPGDKEECTVGEGIGISLSADGAATLIQILIGIVIGLGIIILLVCGAVCGLRKQIKSQKSSSFEIEPLPNGGWNSLEDESNHL